MRWIFIIYELTLDGNVTMLLSCTPKGLPLIIAIRFACSDALPESEDTFVRTIPMDGKIYLKLNSDRASFKLTEPKKIVMTFDMGV